MVDTDQQQRSVFARQGWWSGAHHKAVRRDSEAARPGGRQPWLPMRHQRRHALTSGCPAANYS